MTIDQINIILTFLKSVDENEKINDARLAGMLLARKYNRPVEKKK